MRLSRTEQVEAVTWQRIDVCLDSRGLHEFQEYSRTCEIDAQHSGNLDVRQARTPSQAFDFLQRARLALLEAALP